MYLHPTQQAEKRFEYGSQFTHRRSNISSASYQAHQRRVGLILAQSPPIPLTKSFLKVRPSASSMIHIREVVSNIFEHSRYHRGVRVPSPYLHFPMLFLRGCHRRVIVISPRLMGWYHHPLVQHRPLSRPGYRTPETTVVGIKSGYA